MKTITENPIKANNFFITPKGTEHLMQILETLDRDAMQAAMLTWNLCSKLVDEAIDESEQDNDEIELTAYECDWCGSRDLDRFCDAVWSIDEQK